MEIKKVAIIGSGEMGHGIAEVFAINGYSVSLEDISKEMLEKALNEIRDSLDKLSKKGSIKESVDDVLSRIKTYTDLEPAVKDADLVIEAVPEIEDLKKKIFSDLERFTRSDTILTSNTSNIRITDIAKPLKNRERVAGLHFFNPPVLMKLVEVIKGEETSDEIINALYDLVKKIGKIPVKVMKDSPGFIVNRINAPDMLLFCLLIEHNVATPEEIDAFAKMQGMPMGPYELIDYVGIDVVYHSMEYYAKTLNPDYKKCKVYDDLYNKKYLGKKTGKGFYDWTAGRPHIDTKKATDKVSLMDIFAVEINEAVKLIEEGVATPEDIETGVKYGLNRAFGPISVAKSLTNAEVKAKLEELAKKFNCTVFEPAESIKNGKMREAIEGRLKKKEEKREEKKEEKASSSEQLNTVIVEKFPFRVARITLNRPKHNTINNELLEDLEKAIRMLWDDNEISVVVVTGQGTTFSAGADLSQYFASSFQFLEFARKGERIFRLLSEMPKLTIAVMKGYALGGGFELALACDLRVGTEDVQVGFPEVTIGLVPAWGGSQKLARVVGLGRAMELIMTGQRIQGKDAYSIGLINRLVKDPDNEAIEFAKKIAETSAPISMALAKRLLNKGVEVPMDVGLEMESFAAGVLFSTEDLKEGISSFLQKKKPEFKGR
ncbi:MAG: 3-hydroxyacyl-CoA dehydrogenase/enoyl-CoA hydratase family protein [Thermoplasmata archaeon]|jgi:enoyl-CoA hydratase/3-hydroxyacyl-CoA dehydrogenase|nr:3-hydroxyacyl-CoA dehydrogenase/enoyl-CoA hydratase family protein [Thermoplasmata archaeon]MVT14212.1 3-hydroxyacyl-CoA dehydrogenase [Euryarchaeota archaeon]MVT35893.1 3-hydroxyacyl-CoA dehydrogenase [Euryarchaeota archaeon]